MNILLNRGLDAMILNCIPGDDIVDNLVVIEDQPPLFENL